MQITKKNQLKYQKKRKRIPDLALKVPESSLQKQAEDYLDALQIKYLRVPDGFFKWVKMKAPPYIQATFFKIFGGIPDLIITIPISDKYNNCLKLEIKSKLGKLHGKQIKNAKNEKWQISRSVEETIKIIDEFVSETEILKGYIKAVDLYMKG